MANPNYDFISACDEIIRCLDQASFSGEYIINNVKSNLMGKILDKAWESLCDKNPVLNAINWEAVRWTFCLILRMLLRIIFSWHFIYDGLLF